MTDDPDDPDDADDPPPPPRAFFALPDDVRALSDEEVAALAAQIWEDFVERETDESDGGDPTPTP